MNQLNPNAPPYFPSTHDSSTGGGSSSANSNRRRKARRIPTRNEMPPRAMRPLQPDGEETTLMIRNIPNRYTREMVMEFLDNYCMSQNVQRNVDEGSSRSGGNVADFAHSAYDFFYLPIDFANKANKGYAFVNFTSPKAAWNFYMATNNQKWEYCHSAKVRDIVRAKFQGTRKLISHFTVKVYDCDTDEFLPLLFSPPRDGSNRASVQQRTVGERMVTGATRF